MMTASRIKTRVLIISDTHGAPPQAQTPDDDGTTEDELEGLDQDDLGHVITGFREPLPSCDVAIHCGDLTYSSTLQQYETTFAMMRAIPAPLKLVIAGNHDKTLDENCWDPKRRAHQRRVRDQVDLVIADAERNNVKLLAEGTHSFALSNGAAIKVYASPWTPEYGYSWAYQYDAGHDFDIPQGVDFAITHGPPKGVLDIARSDSTGAGCRSLFRAVWEAKPRVHCFGHIHEGWGAYLARWKTNNDHEETVPSVENCIDGDASKTVHKAVLDPRRRGPTTYLDSSGEPVSLQDILKASKQRGMAVDLTQGIYAQMPGQETLFVNAAIMSIAYQPTQLPWIVDIDLPSAQAAQ